MRPPETVELKHGTRGVNVFLLSKLGCETFGSQLLYLWEITVNEVQFQVPHHSPTLAPALRAVYRDRLAVRVYSCLAVRVYSSVAVASNGRPNKRQNKAQSGPTERVSGLVLYKLRSYYSLL